MSQRCHSPEVGVQVRADLRGDPPGGRGGARDGTLRSHIARPDSSRRDTVYFSVLADEWPAVRDRLTARLRT